MTIFKTSWEELRWLSNHISSILGGYSILLSKIWRLVIIKCWSYQANLDRVRSSRSQMHFQGRPKSASKSQSNVIMSRRARKCKLERKKCSLNVQGTFQSQENISRYSMKFRLHLGANVEGIINTRLIQGQEQRLHDHAIIGPRKRWADQGSRPAKGRLQKVGGKTCLGWQACNRLRVELL